MKGFEVSRFVDDDILEEEEEKDTCFFCFGLNEKFVCLEF